ncbi:lipid-A-disaccharide synthase [Rhizobium sp. G187]|uniref:lipid-A-disaccharide synthase n=1 Tax=Rhizobium sp. G187 TaxID=3451352 RepID=UPI003EE558E6
MNRQPLKIAVVAGEVSGDLLGADLIAALKRRYPGPIELVGVGGEALEAQGLRSLFDYSELSIMGFTQVLSKLPRLLGLISLTASKVVEAKPDLLLIVDSPDFTHRVAKKVRQALPDLPVVKYVCPSVWAWKEYRAKAMLGYVDAVLAVLPFEPEVMQRLGGPPTHFVGHRLASHAEILRIRALRKTRPAKSAGERSTLLLLPGSRSSEITQLLPIFREAVEAFANRNSVPRLILPTVPRQEARVRELTRDWSIQPEIVLGDEAKWQAFGQADAALAASGTVILELALAHVPVVSTYKADWIVRMLANRIKVWTGALPNLIADYVVVPEYFNELVRAASLVRWMERLSQDSLQRTAMLAGFDEVHQKLATEKPASEAGADVVLELIARKGRGA